MDILWSYHDIILEQVPAEFKRFLDERINWDQRMLAIKGPRGAGKTTLMLQHLKHLQDQKTGPLLYITADHSWFYTHSLFETADMFYKEGGLYLYIDEVHKYPNWSRELKNIYDGFPRMNVVFTSSSALDIFRGESDLSRRVATYDLPGMSFREYLTFQRHATFQKFDLDHILTDHRSLSRLVIRQLHPLPLFRKYLEAGYLPFIREVPDEEIGQRMGQIINTVVETDLAYIENYSPGTAQKVKQLLGVLAESAPFKPNIAALARKLGVSRDSIYAWFTALEKARLINLLHPAGKGISLLQKPEKLYLENTNLAYSLKPLPDVGSVRETFLLNQLVNSNQKVRLPKKGDFLINDKIIIEVGGKNKSKYQIKEQTNAFIASNDIETGFGQKIPLWLFGFLY